MTTEAKGLIRTEALDVLRIRSKLGTSEPAKGAHVGSGVHVPMPETWDGSGRVPPGWSGVAGVYEEEVQEERVDPETGAKVITTRKLGTYAVGLQADVEARLARDGSRLEMAERTKLEETVAAIRAREQAENRPLAAPEPERKK